MLEPDIEVEEQILLEHHEVEEAAVDDLQLTVEQLREQLLQRGIDPNLNCSWSCCRCSKLR